MFLQPNARTPISVIMLVKDHSETSSLGATLSEQDIHIVAQVRSAKEANQGIRTHHPDIVFVEMNLAITTGPAAVSLIKTAHPDTCVVAWSSEVSHQSLGQMIQAGASGYIVTTTSPEEIRALLERAIKGEHVYSQDVVTLLERALPPIQYHDQNCYRKLKPNEREAVDLIILGLSNDEIAAYVGNTASWVKQRVRNACKQYGVDTRVELAVAALREGVDPFNNEQYGPLTHRYRCLEDEDNTACPATDDQVPTVEAIDTPDVSEMPDEDPEAVLERKRHSIELLLDEEW
ncbi:response regulator transcription factor [Stomatohabitans albus]|uniref:response regulator transcription factor n=1 Tax=Stomatohabitans albus TaxID=3110766 RepID=UPI00300C525B